MYASVYVHRPAPPARCKLPSERRVPRVSHLGHVVPAVRFDPVDVQPLAQLVAARAQPPRLPVVRLRPAPPAPAHFILRVALTCESTPADSPEGARGWDGEATSQLNGYSTGRALVRQSPMRVLKAGRSEPYSDSMHLSRPARGGARHPQRARAQAHGGAGPGGGTAFSGKRRRERVAGIDLRRAHRQAPEAACSARGGAGFAQVRRHVCHWLDLGTPRPAQGAAPAIQTIATQLQPRGRGGPGAGSAPSRPAGSAQ